MSLDLNTTTGWLDIIRDYSDRRWYKTRRINKKAAFMFLTRYASITHLRKLKMFLGMPMSPVNLCTVKKLLRQNKDLEELHLTLGRDFHRFKDSFMEIICKPPKLKSLSLWIPNNMVNNMVIYTRYKELEDKGCQVCVHKKPSEARWWWMRTWWCPKCKWVLGIGCQPHDLEHLYSRLNKKSKS